MTTGGIRTIWRIAGNSVSMKRVGMGGTRIERLHHSYERAGYQHWSGFWGDFGPRQMAEWLIRITSRDERLPACRKSHCSRYSFAPRHSVVPGSQFFRPATEQMGEERVALGMAF